MAQTVTVTVIRANAIGTGGTEAKMFYHRDLVIEDGIVAGIEDEYKGRVDIEIDATGCLVVPGLVNCHTHAGCTPHAQHLITSATRGAARAWSTGSGSA